MDQPNNRILVLDIEATCWENRRVPEGETQDIIQIGILELDLQQMRSLDCARYYVWPSRSTISPYCTNLTGITSELLLKEATNDFSATMAAIEKRFNPKQKMWATWGNWDPKILAEHFAFHGAANCFGNRHLDIKTLLSFVLRCRGLGLKTALRRLGLKFEGKPHDGLDDAINAARILLELNRGYRDRPLLTC